MTKIKRKGAYEYEREWHQDQSALVIPKAAEKVLIEGTPIREAVVKHPDFMDFMLRVKVPRNSYLVLMDDHGKDTPLQNVTRYFVSEDGGSLIKIMPPLPKKPGHWRRIGIETGWRVTPANDLGDLRLPLKINYEYYIREVEKLVLQMR